MLRTIVLLAKALMSLLCMSGARRLGLLRRGSMSKRFLLSRTSVPCIMRHGRAADSTMNEVCLAKLGLHLENGRIYDSLS